LDYSIIAFEPVDVVRTNRWPDGERRERGGAIYRDDHELGAPTSLGDGFEDVGWGRAKMALDLRVASSWRHKLFPGLGRGTAVA